jgi:phosphoribosylamine---glycine ligase
MVVEGKVFIIEYNARWGDPEVECILPGVRNDWYEVSLAVTENRLNEISLEQDGLYRVVVAACSLGYPEDYSAVKGKEISGLEDLIKTPGIKIYGAGTRVENGKYIANGGRLFYVVAEGASVIEAREKAYAALSKVSIIGENGKSLLHFRNDIGYRDVNRLNHPGSAG